MKKLLFVLLIVLVATTAFAQNKSRIIGTITTNDGAVIAGATVTITSDALISSSLTTTTNERGMYRFVLLPIGTFTMKIEKEGYKTIEQEGLELGYDATLTVDKVMTASDFEEVITITGEAPVVDKTSSKIGDKLDLEFLQNQPNQLRNVWNMPNLTAGFTDDSGMGGVADAGNSFNADGVNISDPSTGTDFASVNLEAVEQIDVSMFGAPAEYGAFTGASINVVTKSGGNEFHGEANYFAQRVDWADDNTEDYELVGTPTVSDLDEFNGSLGGPVVQDKIWFFANFHRQDQNTDFPSMEGGITREQPSRRYFGKVSARWDDKNITFGSYTYYTQERSHRIWFGGWANNYENSMWHQPSDSKNAHLQHSYVINDSLIAEGRFAYFRGGFDLLPIKSGLMLYDLNTSTFLPESGNSYTTMYERARDDLLFTMNYYNDDMNGSHSIKVGAEWERSSGYRYFDQQNLIYTFGSEYYWRIDWGQFESDTEINRYAGFIQDSWSVNDKLTLNLGIRVDRTGWTPGDQTDAPFGTEEFMDVLDIAPRVGFAYDLSGDGKTVVRGFAGRYYEGVTTGNTEAMVCTLPPDREWYWDDSEWVLYSESGGAGAFSIDDDITNQYTEGFTIGIDRELMPNLGASVNFVYKRDRNMLGVINPDLAYESVDYTSSYYNGVVYNIINRGAEIYTNPEAGDPGVDVDLERDFYAVMFSLNKRMSDNYSVKASYTWSRNTGTYGNESYSNVQGFDNFSNPNFFINNGGRLGLDRTHAFKLSGTYIAPFDIYISPAFSYLTGLTYTDYFEYNNDNILVAKNEGEDRYDDQMNIDLRIEKAFVIMDKYRVGLIFDAFNLMNDDAVTAWSTDVESSRYHMPTAVVGARFYQVGIRLLF